MAPGPLSTLLAILLGAIGPDGRGLPLVSVRDGAPQEARDGVVLRGVRRTVLADRVRVVIEFEESVTYTTERLDNPPRVYFDFPGTRLGGTIAEGTLQFTDDVVRHIRVGRRPGQVTRVVLDLDGVRRYSIAANGTASQVVIDCERKPAPRAAPPPARAAVPLSAGARASSDAPVQVREPLRAVARVVQLAAYPVPPDSREAVIVAPAAVMSPAAPAGVAPPAPPAATQPAPTSPPATKPAPPPARPAAEKPAGPHPAVSLARQLGLGAAKIVIDPGHGGHDPGAESAGLHESEVVLDVALKLEKLLKQAGNEVVLTRRGDDYVALEERTAIANREQGDLFLSIHANAHRNRNVSGIETYVLDFASDAGAEAVAARENAATGHTMSNLPEIVKAIALNSKLDESRTFAGLVERAMARQLRGLNRGLHDLGVKQAPFVVLIGASMPSALVEISFITNSQERGLLRNPQYRQKIADALFEAVQGYQKSLKPAGGAANQ
jgi:N-acetylmuramoyl-L-alanine amidase